MSKNQNNRKQLKMDDNSGNGKPSGLRRKASLNVTFCVKKEKSINYKKVYAILQKSESDRTAEENETLENSATIVQEVSSRLEKRRRLKSRSEEIEDSPNVLAEKCRLLAGALLNAQHLVVYSGAGVSTAARIPDYRGTNGIWTRLQQGKDIGCHDLSQAEPTLTHMALFALYRCGKLKHIVSQNCDGLHLRSGVPRSALSEVHGNMYLEVCTPCKLEYWRLFDVTEHTGRYSHETARLCIHCRKPLRDTIVHFGERGALRWPLNWKGACDNADKADIILCIGSSLKVLKRYPWLWCMDKPVKKRPMLFIVNLQWTPKDDQATLKINGKCDEVMNLVMSHLGMNIPKYIRHLDPIFAHATILHAVEIHTTSQPMLELIVKQKEEDSSNKIYEDDQKLSDLNRTSSILIKGEIVDTDDLKLDLVEEEVIITTSIENEDDSEIIECIKMEIDDFESQVIIESSDASLVNKCESPSNHNKNRDTDNKVLKTKNESDNLNISDKLKPPTNELWRPFNDTLSSENNISRNTRTDSNNTDNNKPTCSKDNDDNNLNKAVKISSTCINNSSISVNDDLCSSAFSNQDIDDSNKSKIIIIDKIETAGFSVPLEEFDKLYSKIGKELAKKNSCEFFQEFCSEVNNSKRKFSPINTTNTLFTDNDNNCTSSSIKNVGFHCVKDSRSCFDDKLLNKSTKCSQGNFNANKINNTTINNYKVSTNIVSNKNNSSYCDGNHKNDKFDADVLQTQPLDLSLVKSSCNSIVSLGCKNSFKSDRSSVFCQFCSDNYGSNSCQFYKQLIPDLPDTGPFCYCCYDDDSDNENPTDKSDQNMTDKNNADKKNPVDSSTNKVPIINPGWFGKGYRKRSKKKR